MSAPVNPPRNPSAFSAEQYEKVRLAVEEETSAINILVRRGDFFAAGDRAQALMGFIYATARMNMEATKEGK